MVVDSGAYACFINQEVTQQLDLEQVSLSLPVPARELDGHCLGTIAHQNQPCII